MRNIKSAATALVALVGILLLAGCAPTSNAADVDCSTSAVVAEQLKDAKADLKLASASLAQTEGTARAVSASQDVETAKATVDELKECPSAKDADTASDATDAPSVCGDAKFDQVYIDRSATSKVEPRYDGEIRPIIADASLTAEQKVEAIKAVDLKLAASNMQTLAAWAKGLGLYDAPNAWPELVEGGKIVDGACPTEAGKMLFMKYEVAYELKGITLEVGTAPSNLTNTAINGDTNMADSIPGIYGDTTAVIMTLPDGSKFIRLVRCGNVVYPGPPSNVPPGITDNPRCEFNPNLPPGHPSCVPPTCPPGTIGTPPNCNNLKWVNPSPTEEGWDPRGTDNGLTDGQESARQLESGDTRGNTVNDQVPSNTGTGTTTPDTIPSSGGGPVADGATAGGDDQSQGGVDDENTNQDPGGTTGDTCVPDPIAGITC